MMLFVKSSWKIRNKSRLGAMQVTFSWKYCLVYLPPICLYFPPIYLNLPPIYPKFTSISPKFTSVYPQLTQIFLNTPNLPHWQWSGCYRFPLPPEQSPRSRGRCPSAPTTCNYCWCLVNLLICVFVCCFFFVVLCRYCCHVTEMQNVTDMTDISV